MYWHLYSQKGKEGTQATSHGVTPLRRLKGKKKLPFQSFGPSDFSDFFFPTQIMKQSHNSDMYVHYI